MHLVNIYPLDYHSDRVCRQDCYLHLTDKETEAEAKAYTQGHAADKLFHVVEFSLKPPKVTGQEM